MHSRPPATTMCLVGRGCLPDSARALEARVPGGQIVLCCDENVAPLYLGTAGESPEGRPAIRSPRSLSRPGRPRRAWPAPRSSTVCCTTAACGAATHSWRSGAESSATSSASSRPPTNAGFASSRRPPRCSRRSTRQSAARWRVDFRSGKNYVGCFYQPSLVFADVGTLISLPGHELRSGSAEVAKYALVDGGELLERCEGLAARERLSSEQISQALVASCIQRKLDVVAAGRARGVRCAARCSTSATPSVTRSRGPLSSRASRTAKRWGSACAPRYGCPRSSAACLLPMPPGDRRCSTD